jgi:V8-like Glu-specific endopeptidase
VCEPGPRYDLFATLSTSPRIFWSGNMQIANPLLSSIVSLSVATAAGSSAGRAQQPIAPELAQHSPLQSAFYERTERYWITPEQMSQPPFNALLKLWRYENKVGFACVAFAVDRQILLTSAHCVIDSDHSISKHISAYFGLYGISSVSDYKTVKVILPVVTYVSDPYANVASKGIGDDCAVLKVDPPLPSETVPLEIDVDGFCESRYGHLEAAGYELPDDLHDPNYQNVPFHDPFCHQNHFDSTLFGVRISQNTIFVDCNISATGSGSPIFCSGPSKEKYAIAVFKGARGDDPDDDGTRTVEYSWRTTGYATRLSACYPKVMELRAELYGKSPTKK